MGGGDQLLRAGLPVGRLGARRARRRRLADTGEDSRDTWPAPSMSEPSQWAEAVRVVAISWSSRGGGLGPTLPAVAPLPADRGADTGGWARPARRSVPSPRPIHLETTDPVATVTIDRPHRRNALDLEALEDLHRAVVTPWPARRAPSCSPAPTGTSAPAPTSPSSRTSRSPPASPRSSSTSPPPRSSPSRRSTARAWASACSSTSPATSASSPTAATLRRPRGPPRPHGRPLDPRPRHPHLGRECGAAHGPHRRRPHADDAWRLGSAQPRGDLDEAQALAARAAALAPLSQAGSKIGFDARHDDLAEIARYEAAFARAWASDDLAEGRRAFTERRDPGLPGTLDDARRGPRARARPPPRLRPRPRPRRPRPPARR